MLFRRAVLDAIAEGAVTVAFRRWRRPTVKAGGELRTPAGVLAIEAVDLVAVGAITEADARRAGFATRKVLLAELGVTDGHVHRIALRFAGADPRVALRSSDALTDDEVAALGCRLERLDATSRHGAWTWSVLAMIGARPGVAAAELAERLGRDRASLKGDVRRLGKLGLTESLRTGYQLSPRGRAILDRRGEHDGAVRRRP